MSNTKIDNTRLNQLIEQDYEKQKKSPLPHAQDIHYFEKQLTQQDQKQDKEDPYHSLYSLSSFFTIPQQENSLTPEIDTDNNLQEKLLNHILISQANAKEQEIRLQLKQDILADTEIRLIKNTDGTLTIQMFTSNPHSFQTLVANQFRLKEKFDQLENMNVSITIYNNNPNPNDTNQQSRGYANYQTE